MPADAALDAATRRATPGASEGALGTWRFRRSGGHRTQSRVWLIPDWRDGSAGEPALAEVYARCRLSLAATGQTRGGWAKVRPGLGKSDRPGSQGGLENRGPWWSGDPSSQPKVRGRKPSTYRQARSGSIPTQSTRVMGA